MKERKPMFSVGQTVYHKTRKHSGKVLECDGDTVYFVQANGVLIIHIPQLVLAGVFGPDHA
jgi:hypothetical protein